MDQRSRRRATGRARLHLWTVTLAAAAVTFAATTPTSTAFAEGGPTEIGTVADESGDANAEASEAATPYTALQVDAGPDHTCAVIQSVGLRCWGAGEAVLGVPGAMSVGVVGDDEPAGSIGPVNVGAGRTAVEVRAGGTLTCARLDDGTVRCWGYNSFGQLGRGDFGGSFGDDEHPGSLPIVNLGAGRTARALTVGDTHACAILDNNTVRCWGNGAFGRLGYGNQNNVGDNEIPGSVGPVNLGAGRTATAIAAGQDHTCAILDTGVVRCWGSGFYGKLGYGNENHVGDNETPAAAGTVNLGPGRTAVAIDAGPDTTCVVLDNAAVKCWGFGGDGRLGYASSDTIGDDETPAAVGTVGLGAGATSVATGNGHTCAILVGGSVRCWGWTSNGVLGGGPGRMDNWVGDDENPSTEPVVSLGSGRTAVSISAFMYHTCAVLDDGTARCWGFGSRGRLGYGNTNDIGDDETPGSAGPVPLGFAPNYRPDAMVRLGTGPNNGGNDYRTADFPAQNVFARARIGAVKKLTVTTQNDGTGNDRVFVRGPGTSTTFRIRYYLGTTDITAQVKAGTYLTPSLAPKAKHEIRMEVTRLRAAPQSSLLLRFTSQSRSNRVDALTVDFY